MKFSLHRDDVDLCNTLNKVLMYWKGGGVGSQEVKFLQKYRFARHATP